MFLNIIENLTGIRIRPGEADEGAVGQKTNIAIIGAGNLGRALANSRDFEKRGFHVTAMFDNRRLVLAPILIIVGFVVEILAIMYKSKKQ